jgi:hypothetical protein
MFWENTHKYVGIFHSMKITSILFAKGKREIRNGEEIYILFIAFNV